MSLYGRLFASAYDRVTAGVERAGLGERRRGLVGQASGRVIEIGAGTGANLGYYSEAVTSLTLTEPDEAMAIRLDRRCAKQSRPATIVHAPAEALPFTDGSFDTAVCTLVLCTVPDPAAALAEIQRVLVPGGTLLFLEHVRSSDPGLARWQDRLNGVQNVIGRGCNCNRPTASLIESAGFRLERVEGGELRKAPPIVRPIVVGAASAAETG